jgi:hypothetical protein
MFLIGSRASTDASYACLRKHSMQTLLRESALRMALHLCSMVMARFMMALRS